MKMKTTQSTSPARVSVFSLPSASEDSETRLLFQENPLARGLPFCGFKISDQSSPRFIALVLRSDSSLKLVDGMTDVVAAWRLAFRMHDVPEYRVNVHDKKKLDTEIPPEILQGLLGLVDNWSFELGSQGSSVQDRVMQGSSTRRSADVEALSELSVAEFIDITTAVDNAEEPIGTLQCYFPSRFHCVDFFVRRCWLHSAKNILSSLRAQSFAPPKSRNIR